MDFPWKTIQLLRESQGYGNPHITITNSWRFALPCFSMPWRHSQGYVVNPIHKTPKWQPWAKWKLRITRFSKDGICLKDFLLFFLKFFLFFSLGQFSLLFAAFWNQNLWFACFLVHFGAKSVICFWLLAFGFWLGFSIAVCILMHCI